MPVFERSRPQYRDHRWRTQPVDSRQYIIPFTISSAEAVPPDFRLEPVTEFRHGLFLPRADPDWRGRSAWPARVVVLTGSALIVATHPLTAEPEMRLPLSGIVGLETGNMLLIGWIALLCQRGPVR
ncbi:MAG TPA: hypothetical protein VMD76_07785, partial [Candidatus Sulfotelmatobacter sp.]|nr:hypothetical protein [Candidatus Sulfotelmatobacter sp.]